MISYQLRSSGKYDSKIGELVWMLEHTRAVTVNEVKDLTNVQLNRRFSSQGNTIGELLQHIAAIEKVHQVISFENRDLTSREMEEWKPSLFLSFNGETDSDHSSSYYLHLLDTIRTKTLKGLGEQSDEWLKEERVWPNEVKHNPHYLWFHVMEDEINHRGQIRMMLRQMKEEESHEVF